MAGATFTPTRAGTAQAAVPPYLATVAAALLTLVVPVLVADGVTDLQTQQATAWLAVAVMVVSGARFAWLFGLGEPRLMEFSLWTFTYLFLGLAPLVQVLSGRFPGTIPYLDPAYNEAGMWAVLVGVAAVLAGITWAQHGRAGVGRAETRVSEGRTIFLAVLALLLNAYFLSRVGPGTLLQSRDELWIAKFNAWPDEGLASLVHVASSLPLLVAFIALLQVNRRRVARGRPRLMLLTIATGAAALYAANPLSNSRYFSGTVILAVAAALGAYATRNRVRASSMSLLLGLFLLFPLAGIFRREESTAEVNPMLALTTGDFDGLAQMSTTMMFLEREGIMWGWQALGTLLWWVPRSVWPEKPTSTGAMLADWAGAEFTNVSSPLWSELLVDGGWPLLVLGMFVFGWWLRRADMQAVQLFLKGERPTVLFSILPFYLLILLRGSLLQAMVALSVMVVSSWFVRQRAPRR